MTDLLNRKLAQLNFWAAFARMLLLTTLIASGLILGGAVSEWLGVTSARQLIIFLGIAGAIWVLALLLAVPVVCVWIYRAHANLRAFGAEVLNYSPGWAVGSFFVPFINLVVPFRAMRELYNLSIGESADFSASDAPDVSAWWTTFVACNLIVGYFAMVAGIESRTPFFLTTPPLAALGLRVFALLLWVVSTIFLMRVIRSVSVAQRSISGVRGVFA